MRRSSTTLSLPIPLNHQLLSHYPYHSIINYSLTTHTTQSSTTLSLPIPLNHQLLSHYPYHSIINYSLTTHTHSIINYSLTTHIHSIINYSLTTHIHSIIKYLPMHVDRVPCDRRCAGCDGHQLFQITRRGEEF